MNIRYINSNIIRKRILLILVIIVFIFVIIYSQNSSENCFEKFQFSDGKTLPDIVQNKLAQRTNSKNIFFHETSCNPGN